MKTIDTKKIYLYKVQFALFFKDSTIVEVNDNFYKILGEIGFDKKRFWQLPTDNLQDDTQYLHYQSKERELQLSKSRADIFLLKSSAKFDDKKYLDYVDWYDENKQKFKEFSQLLLDNVKVDRIGLVVDYIYDIDSPKKFKSILNKLKNTYFNIDTYNGLNIKKFVTQILTEHKISDSFCNIGNQVETIQVVPVAIDNYGKKKVQENQRTDHLMLRKDLNCKKSKGLFSQGDIIDYLEEFKILTSKDKVVRDFLNE